MEVVKPFNYGDVCMYIGEGHGWEGEHIVEEISRTGENDYEYSTSQGAWIDHSDLTLVKKSSEESRAKLWDLLLEEWEDEE